MTGTPTRPAKPAQSVTIVDPAIVYEVVATSQTAQVMGTDGAAGDWLERVIIQPLTTTPGVVTVIDATASNSTPIAFPGGTTTIEPIVIEFRAYSKFGAWKITTGAAVTATAVGRFS